MIWLMLSFAAAVDGTVADRICANCHKAIVERYYGTAQAHGNSMSRALYTIEQATLLRDTKKPLEFRLGKYAYRLSGSSYNVSDGSSSLALTLAYAFGQGAAGQTYVFQHEGLWYKSRVSYYKETQSFDLTMGAPPGEPKSLLEAAGREMTPKDVTACFGCHTTNSIVSGKVTFDRLQAGIGCQNCHADAMKHARTMQPQTSLAKLTTEEQSDLCGRCHRTWADIASGGPRGVGNVRFQPYRIANSKCYDAADRRIACTACHDPHSALQKNVKSYDSSCLSCHGKDKKVCSNKQVSGCAGCHMPKYEIPGSHHLFSDHQIRIVRPNEKYPN
jgi:Zn finger protein HypA/HybF involved in hydrogenase expression